MTANCEPVLKDHEYHAEKGGRAPALVRAHVRAVPVDLYAVLPRVLCSFEGC
jgi:hypothetical protein